MSNSIIELKKKIDEHFQKLEDLNSDRQQYGGSFSIATGMGMAMGRIPTQSHVHTQVNANNVYANTNALSMTDMVSKHSSIYTPIHNKDKNSDNEYLLVNDDKAAAIAAAGTGAAIITAALAKAKYNDETTSPDEIKIIKPVDKITNIDNLRYLIEIHFKKLTNII
jgi:hypothetical protein